VNSQNDPLVIRVPETCSLQNYQKIVSSIPFPKNKVFGMIDKIWSQISCFGTRTISGNSFDLSLSLSQKQDFGIIVCFIPN
jgi:hypothetical protein